MAKKLLLGMRELDLMLSPKVGIAFPKCVLKDTYFFALAFA